jgi:hypothetical protein
VQVEPVGVLLHDAASLDEGVAREVEAYGPKGCLFDHRLLHGLYHARLPHVVQLIHPEDRPAFQAAV